MINQEQEQKFLAYIEKNMHVKLVSKRNDVFYFHYVGNSREGGAATYIAGAKYVAKIEPEEIQVLVEYPTAPSKRKYAFHGSHQITKMLSTMYGGYVSLDLYWTLDNVRNTGNIPFGYNKRINSIYDIEGDIIAEQIRHIQENCYVVTPQQLQSVK